MQLKRTIKIVITGGPGGGKTTALDLFRREFVGKSCIVPEAATVLFSSNIPRAEKLEDVKSLQKAIFNLQHTLEDLISAQNPNKLLICDRGSLDGLAYWPGSEEEFFTNVKSSFDEEMSHYDAVIFFETAAASGKDINSNNPYRNEDTKKAIDLDQKLQNVWSQHHNFHLIKSSNSFLEKILTGIKKIEEVILEFKN